MEQFPPPLEQQQDAPASEQSSVWHMLGGVVEKSLVTYVVYITFMAVFLIFAFVSIYTDPAHRDFYTNIITFVFGHITPVPTPKLSRSIRNNNGNLV